MDIAINTKTSGYYNLSAARVDCKIVRNSN